MLLLTVRVNEATKKIPASEFQRAWYRLVNDETSQTLDYKLFNQVNTPDSPDNAGAVEGDAEEGGASGEANKSYTYVAGRIFFDHRTNKWVYEAFNHVFGSDRFGTNDLS